VITRYAKLCNIWNIMQKWRKICKNHIIHQAQVWIACPRLLHNSTVVEWNGHIRYLDANPYIVYKLGSICLELRLLNFRIKWSIRCICNKHNIRRTLVATTTNLKWQTTIVTNKSNNQMWYKLQYGLRNVSVIAVFRMTNNPQSTKLWL